MACADINTDDEQHWSLESLNKAYQQGYMAGLTGQTSTPRTPAVDVLMAAWEAGWDDGNEQYALHKRHSA